MGILDCLQVYSVKSRCRTCKGASLEEGLRKKFLSKNPAPCIKQSKFRPHNESAVRVLAVFPPVLSEKQCCEC